MFPIPKKKEICDDVPSGTRSELKIIVFVLYSFIKLISIRLLCRQVHRKVSAHVDGGREEDPLCADPVTRTPIGVSGIF